MSEYTRFAQVYDAFMKDAPYDDWVTFTDEACRQADFHPKSIIDLGCGTGEIALRLAEKGYTVTGVDMSPDMLTIADQKSQAKNVPVTWVHQDIRALAGIHQVDLAISYCDVVNYITDEADIEQAFQRIYDSLQPNGMFIFDFHALSYVEEHLVDHTFTDVNDEMAYIWDCFGTETVGEMVHELTFFMKQQHAYIRFDEEHHQRTFHASFYTEALEKAGFSKMKITNDFLTENEKQEEIHERKFIVAQKQSR